jgi:hypothetical protein
MTYTLKDDGYATFKKIMLGGRLVGRVFKREHDYEGIIGDARARAFTEREALEAVVEAVGGSLPQPRSRRTGTIRPRMKTLATASDALDMAIADHKAGRPALSYGAWAERLGVDKRRDARWFGKISGLIDAACVLADVPCFGLSHFRLADGSLNRKSWRNQPEAVREIIHRNAEHGSWSEHDLEKIKDCLAEFMALQLGPTKAWEHVKERVDVAAWATRTVPVPEQDRTHRGPHRSVTA